MQKVKWLDYELIVYEHNTTWNDVPGIYVFCGLNPQNQWVPIYIGQTDSFRTRIPQHEQWNPAVRHGATHVHAMTVAQQATRDRVEQELIRVFCPALNVQHTGR